MGGKCPHRSVKKRCYSHKTARRTKFLLKGDDAVYDELHKAEGEGKPLPVDEDLPGMGQYYCLHCDRYFANVVVRDEHFKTKKHRRRVKQMMGAAPHTQIDVELAAGMGMPDNGPKLMSIVKQMMGAAPHTQIDVELAAGMGMPDNGPKLMSIVKQMMGLHLTHKLMLN